MQEEGGSRFAQPSKEKEWEVFTTPWEIMTGFKEKYYLDEDGKALEQATQRIC